MIRCVYNECQWPNCDKTCGMVPEGDYAVGSCAEEALIYHLQKRIEELKNTVWNMRLGVSRIRQDAGQFLNAYHPEPTEYQACSMVCPFGEGDCIHNPEYIRRHYPNWWVELGMPTTCDPNACRYDDEDK